MTQDISELVAQMRLWRDDPMWADHAEVPKAQIATWADALERLQRERYLTGNERDNLSDALHDANARAETAERALATARAEARAEAFREAMRVVEQWLQQMADMGAPILNADLPRALRARAEESKPHE